MRDRAAMSVASAGLIGVLLIAIAAWAAGLPSAAVPSRTPLELGIAHLAPPSTTAQVGTVPPAPTSTEAPPVVDAGTPIAPPPAVFDGETAPAAPAQQPAVGVGRGAPGVYGVFIGIDDYPGSGGDLAYAVEDADTADLAVGSLGVPAENRLVLRDGQATGATIRAAVTWLVERAGPGSTAVFMFAGHVRDLGGGTEAMVAADGDTLTDVELAGLLAPASADHIWVVLASCYAGGFTEVLAPGRILTAAAPAGQLAYESSAMGGSYLVGYLFREGWLERRAGSTVQEAFAFAYQQIASSRPERVPVQVDHAGEPVPIGASQPVAPPVAPSPQPAPTTTTAPPPAQPSSNHCLLGFCRSS